MVLQNHPEKGIWVILFLFAGAATFCDMCTGKIPNRLLISGGIVGIAFGIFHMFYRQDYWYLLPCLLKFFLLFFILWPIYQIGALGAGDCKLLLLIGTFLPMKISVFILISSMTLAAGVGISRNIIRHFFLKKQPISGIHFSGCILLAMIFAILRYGLSVIR